MIADSRDKMIADGRDKAWSLGIVTNPFSAALGRDYVTDELRRALKNAEILLVPQDGFRDHDGPLFPVGTEELVQLLRDRSEGARIDLAVEDSDYQELALHSDVLTIASVVVTSVLVPLVLDVLGEFIKRRIWKTNDDRTVRAEIVICRSREDETSSARIAYDGPADQFTRAMQEAMGALRRGEGAAGVQIDIPEKAALPASEGERK